MLKIYLTFKNFSFANSRMRIMKYGKNHVRLFRKTVSFIYMKKNDKQSNTSVTCF